MSGFSKRHSLVFACGLLFGIFVSAAVLSGLKSPGTAANAAPAPAPEPVPVVQGQTGASASPQGCGFAPLLVAAPQGDGKFPAPMNTRGTDALDVPAYIAVAADAAAQKRPRDAEIAYITACRIASQLAQPDPVRLAEAQYDLANHYLQALPSSGIARQAAIQRAESLFSESVTLYGAKFGLDDEKTRLAAVGLANAQATDPTPAVARAASEIVEVPRVLLAERNTLPMTTVAMGAPPVKKHKPKIEVEEASAQDDAKPPQDEPQPVRRDTLKLDTGPRSSGQPDGSPEPVSP